MSVVAFAPAVLEPTAIDTDLTEAEARALTAGLRADLAALTAGLQRAFHGRAWIAMGYSTYKDWITAELGDALVGLGGALRLEVVGALSDAGISARGAAPLMGFKSDQTFRRLLKEARPDGVTTAPRGIDGKVYARSSAASQAVVAAKPLLALPGPKKTTTTLDLLEAAGAEGMTIPELQKRKRWSYTQTSTTLSRLNASRDVEGLRRVERLHERRGAYAVYVLPKHVAGRETLQPGQRLPRPLGDD